MAKERSRTTTPAGAPGGDAPPANAVAVGSADMPASYAAGLTAGSREITNELGTTGLKGAEPYAGWIYEEFLPPLRGLAGARMFKEMADNDPMCGGVLFALEMLMRNVGWRVDPKDETPAAVEIAARIHSALFEDMAHPWGQLIDEASSMMAYGYAPHEIVWKRCRGETTDPNTSSNFTDQLWMPAALPIRSQDTMWRWIFDTQGRGHLLGFEQFRMSFPNAIIPASKALIFRTESNRNNPEGRSVLRNAYIPYLRKKVIEESEGRLAQRSAGVVVVRIPARLMEAGAGTDEQRLFLLYKNMADKLAQDRQGSAVIPSDADEKGNKLYDISYVVADSRNVKDFTPIVDRMDVRIAVSVLADFLLLGTKNVGSFALADSKTSLFVLAVEGFLAVIAEQINRVLLRKIWKLNALDPALMPMVKPGEVQKPDLERLGNYLSQLARAGAPMFPSESGQLEQWALGLAGAPSDQQAG